MPPTCALLGIAVPEKPGDRPFRFLDLPGEIRNMVYRLLMGRRVVDGVVEIDLVKRYASIENCYYPAMMRVNKQVEDEYAAFVIPRMLLSVFWTTTHMSETSTHQILPKKVLSQMKFFEMSVWINHPLSDLDTSSLVTALVQALPCDMPQLSFFSLQIIYLLDELSQPGAPVEMGQISAWKQTMTASLAALVKNNARLTVEADFDIMCALYSLLPGVARGDDHIPRPSGAKPLATFAVCNGPDKDTFELDGCNVKFLGVGGNLIDRDNNTQIILIGEDMLDK